MTKIKLIAFLICNFYFIFFLFSFFNFFINRGEHENSPELLQTLMTTLKYIKYLKKLFVRFKCLHVSMRVWIHQCYGTHRFQKVISGLGSLFHHCICWTSWFASFLCFSIRDAHLTVGAENLACISHLLSLPFGGIRGAELSQVLVSIQQLLYPPSYPPGQEHTYFFVMFVSNKLKLRCKSMEL